MPFQLITGDCFHCTWSSAISFHHFVLPPDTLPMTDASQLNRCYVRPGPALHPDDIYRFLWSSRSRSWRPIDALCGEASMCIRLNSVILLLSFINRSWWVDLVRPCGFPAQARGAAIDVLLYCECRLNDFIVGAPVVRGLEERPVAVCHTHTSIRNAGV